MTHEPRIGECDACHARFKIPASFLADRARCRECGGMVILAGTQPVPRPALDRRRTPRTNASAGRDVEQGATGRPSTARASESGVQRVQESVPEPAEANASSEAQPARPAQSKSTASRLPAPKLAAPKTSDSSSVESTSGAKKPAGVLGSIVAAAKAAVWRKKRRARGSNDEPAAG